MTLLRSRPRWGRPHRQGTRPPALRASISPVTATVCFTLLLWLLADVRAASAAGGSPVSPSRLFAAATRIRDPAKEARLRWELARVLRDAGRSDEAIVEYRKALALDGSLSEARAELSRLLRARGLPAEAAEEYRILLRAHPADATLRRELAETWLEADQEDRAMSEFERLVATRPSDPAAERRLIERYAIRGRWTEVIRVARSHLAHAPHDAQTRRDLAAALVASQRTAEAIVEYERLIAADSKDVEALEGLARAQIASGTPYLAVEVYRRVLTLHPRKREATLGEAQALAVAGEYGGAMRAYANILAEDSKEIRAWLGTADLLAWSQRYDEAEAWYLGALRTFPDDPALLLGYVSVLLSDRRFADAGDSARRAAQHGADVTRAALLEAEALRQLGKPEEARRVLGQVVVQRPEDARPLVALGELALSQGQAATAAAEFRRAVAISPRLVRARYGLWKAERDGRGEKDGADLILELVPGSADPFALAQVGELLAADGRFAKGAEACVAAIAASPDLVAARFTLAEALAARGDYGPAASAYRRLLERHPENLKARLGLARVLSWSQQFKDAVAEYDRILSMDPRNPPAQRERARVLGWAQRFAEAREGYDRILRDPPTGPGEPLNRLLEKISLEREAKEALWLGRYGTAAEIHDRLLRLEPGNEEARFDRAQALSQLGRWRSAELAYLDLLALDPFHRQAAIARERAAIEQGPRGGVQYEFFQSRGRGTLADLRRQKVSTSVGLPLAGDGPVLTAEYAHTFFPIGDFELDAYTLRLEGRLGRHLAGFLRATHHDYLAPLSPKQNYEAALDYRLFDRATLTLNYRREDIHENRESLSQQIQRDIVTVKGEVPLTIRSSVGGAYSYARYSDDNDRRAFEVFGSHQFSLYPRVLKLTYTLAYQDFSRATIFPPEGGSIPTVHPYFAPSNFFTNALTVQWRHYFQKDLFLGARQCYYDLQWTPAIESVDTVFSNLVRGEVLCDLTQRFTILAQGLISRSRTYEAEQISLQVLYRF